MWKSDFELVIKERDYPQITTDYFLKEIEERD